MDTDFPTTSDGASLPDDPHELDALLSDWRWLGDLARRIVLDESSAEDARQSAWLEAAARAGPGRPSRSKLYFALRRFVSNAHRGDRRRRGREAAVSRPDQLPSTEELIQRGEQQRRLWDMIRDLPEPERTTLLLHFQDGLATKEIAARSGVAVDTVRGRLRRGIGQLRGRLAKDEAGGGLAAFAVAIPWKHTSAAKVAAATTSSGALGALAMSKVGWTTLAVLTVALALTAALTWERDGRARPDAAGRSGAAVPDPVSEADVPLPSPARGQRVEQSADGEIAASAARDDTSADRAMFTGRVVALDGGAPLKSARVVLEKEREVVEEGVTSESGAYAVSTAFPEGQTTCDITMVVIDAGPYFALGNLPIGSTRGAVHGAPRMPSEAQGSTAGEGQLQARLGVTSLPARGALRGRVVNTRGEPVEDCWLTADGNHRGQDLNAGSGGRFNLGHVKPGTVTLNIVAFGYLEMNRAARVTVGETVDVGDIVLDDAPYASGVVLDPAGEPMGGAWVSAAGLTRESVTTTDAEGAFRVAFQADRPRQLSVYAEGFIHDEEIVAKPGQTGIVLRLTLRGAKCRFELQCASTGDPITVFGAQVHRNEGHAAPKPHPIIGWGRPTARSRTSNGFSITARPGLDVVSVFAPGFAPREFEIDESSISAPQRLLLKPSPGVHGRVLLGGDPVEGAEVTMHSAIAGRVQEFPGGADVPMGTSGPARDAMKVSGPFSPVSAVAIDRPLPPVMIAPALGMKTVRTTTGPDGRFLFRDFPKAVGGIVIEHGGHFASTGALAIGLEHRTDLGDLTLRPGPEVWVQLEVPSGADLSGHTVRADHPTPFSVKTDENGRASLPPLAAGDYFMSVEPALGTVINEDASPDYHFVRLAPGGSRTIQLSMATVASALVTARVRCNGKAPVDAELSFVSADADPGRGQLASGTLDADGLCTVSLPAGVPVRLEIRSGWAETPIQGTHRFEPGARTLEIDLETCGLDIELPARVTLGENTRAQLTWTWPEGGTGRLLADEVTVQSAADGRSVATVRVSALPLTASDVKLVVTSGRPYGDKSTDFEGPVECSLSPGGRVEITLP